MRRGRQDIKIYVESLQLFESGYYHDIHLRPYAPELDSGLIDRIGNKFERARKFTPALLTEIAHQFIVPDYQTRGLIEIPNGWDTRRGRFVLTLDIRVGTGDRMQEIIIGYTNAVGFTTNNVDPDMDFYVNSTFMLKETSVRTSRGWRNMMVPMKINDVLADRDSGGLRGRGPKQFTMRPEDIYSSMDARQTVSLVDELTDLRTTLNRNAVYSSNDNRIGSKFMSKVLSSRQKALDNLDYGNEAVDLNATSQAYSQESYSGDDVFLAAISKIQGTSLTSDHFTFDDLLQLDPDAEDRTNLMLYESDAKAASRYADMSVETTGGEESDRIAALIAMAVPALMIESGLAGISFQVHNQDSHEGFEFVPGKAVSFVPDVDLSDFIDRFEDRLIDELLNPITIKDQVSIGLQCSCDLYGNVDFTLYFDGEDCGRFIYPAFCNSLASPILTTDGEDVLSMTRSFNKLFDEFLPTSSIGGRRDEGRDFDF